MTIVVIFVAVLAQLRRGVGTFKPDDAIRPHCVRNAVVDFGAAVAATGERNLSPLEDPLKDPLPSPRRWR